MTVLIFLKDLAEDQPNNVVKSSPVTSNTHDECDEKQNGFSFITTSNSARRIDGYELRIRP